MYYSFLCHILGFSLRHGTNDIRISRISDGQCAHTEVLSTSGTQFIVVSSVMMDSSLGQHGVVLDFRFSAKTQNKRSILFKHLTLYFVFLKFLTRSQKECSGENREIHPHLKNITMINKARKSPPPGNRTRIA